MVSENRVFESLIFDPQSLFVVLTCSCGSCSRVLESPQEVKVRNYKKAASLTNSHSCTFPVWTLKLKRSPQKLYHVNFAVKTARIKTNIRLHLRENCMQICITWTIKSLNARIQIKLTNKIDVLKCFGSLDDFLDLTIYTLNTRVLSAKLIKYQIHFVLDKIFTTFILSVILKKKTKTEVSCILLDLTILSDLNELCDSLLSKVRKIVLLRGISPNKWWLSLHLLTLAAVCQLLGDSLLAVVLIS